MLSQDLPARPWKTLRKFLNSSATGPAEWERRTLSIGQSPKLNPADSLVRILFPRLLHALGLLGDLAALHPAAVPGLLQGRPLVRGLGLGPFLGLSLPPCHFGRRLQLARLNDRGFGSRLATGELSFQGSLRLGRRLGILLSVFMPTLGFGDAELDGHGLAGEETTAPGRFL